MKISILFKFVIGPWGGGNQFLNNLKKAWERQDKYCNNPKDADFILFNSHHQFKNVIKLKLKYPQKLFVHRIDGPMSGYRKHNTLLDKLIFLFAKELADGVVFQSQWSLNKSKILGYTSKSFEKVIHNRSDREIFYPSKVYSSIIKGKIKLIALSWSSNLKKGFDIYSYLDKNLDFNKYEFTFIGNSPVKFTNIKQLKPMSPEDISTHLRESHIMVFASEVESCSNTIIEGLSCGLPIIYKNDSSNPEIVKQSGLPFSTGREAINVISKLMKNYNEYKESIDISSIIQVADEYYSLFQEIHDKKVSNLNLSSNINSNFLLKYKALYMLSKLENKYRLNLTKSKKFVN